jgi:glutamate racemase
MKIGFFDSGLGGLTVLKAVREHLPMYDYVYYGDTLNLPYGDKSEEQILTFTKNAVEYLFDHGALIVIVACNTASSEALSILQDTMLVGKYSDRKLLGVIIPTIETLLESGAKNALLIGTVRTIGSQKYLRELEKASSKIQLDSTAMPVLVPYIENGDIENAHLKVAEVIASGKGDIDTVILGCTHYTVLKDFIRKKFNLRVISQDEIIPKKLQTYLEKHTEIQSRLTQGGSLEIFLSEETERYKDIKKEMFGI